MSEETSVTSTPVTESTQQTASTETSTEAQSTPQEVVEEMIKLKVMGEEKEYPRSEVLKFAQQGLGANRKFEEVAKARKELESVVNNLIENPTAFLRNHPNREAIIQASQDLLAEWVEEQDRLSKMSDSERKALELQKELEKRQKELDERDNQIKQQLQKHYRSQFEKEILSALNNTELPVSEGSVMRVANLYKQALNNGINTTFEQCAKIVEKDYLGYLDDIGKKRAKTQKQKLRVVSNQSAPKKESRKISMQEFQERLKQLSNH